MIQYLHNIQSVVGGYAWEVVHELSDNGSTEKDGELEREGERDYREVELEQGGSTGRVKLRIGTLVKKPRRATGRRVGWRMEREAGQAKFQSCSTKLPNK